MHQTLTGAEFTKLHSDKKFVKLTTETENHNGFQFKTGLNIDTLQFSPVGECKAGGLYFCEYDEISQWYSYGDKHCIYYREVKLPDDASVYTEYDKYKTDKFILSERKKIWTDIKICEMIICRDIVNINDDEEWEHPLKYVENQTEEICKMAVKQNGFALEFVENQTEEICKMAVKQNGYALQYVKEKYQTEEIWKIAIEKNEFALKHVINQTEEICKLAVKHHRDVFKYVNDKYQTEEICKLAVTQCGLTLEFVKVQTEEICKLAVKQNGYMLQYVKDQTDEICKLAVMDYGRALGFVKNKTDEIRELATKQILSG